MTNFGSTVDIVTQHGHFKEGDYVKNAGTGDVFRVRNVDGFTATATRLTRWERIIYRLRRWK